MPRTFYICLSTMILIALCPLCTANSYADEQVVTTKENIPVLPKITVTGSHIDTITAAETIDKELIEKLPKSNGNVTELLKVVPGVQFSEKLDSSRTGGEIRPPEISISGGRTADNSYIFDGGSNNSILDPDFSSYHNTDNVPGHSQRLFLLDHLINDITVLRANIPARYGGFTGGVVDMNSIDPDTVFRGELSYRTTRSSWGKFHIDEEDKEDFYNSINADDQPRFNKHQASITVHAPLNLNMGLLFDYSRNESTIPLYEFDRKKDQHRRNENFFLKYVASPRATTEIRLSTTYAPYKGDYSLSKTRNSDFSLTGGGYRFDSGLTQQSVFGKLELLLNIQTSENSREAPNNWYSWRVTPSKDWGTTASLEGAYGDLEKRESSIETGMHFTSKEIQSEPATYTISMGSELNYTEATYDRTEEFTQYIARLADGSKGIYPVLPCPPGDPLCIEGEQYMYFKNTRPKNKAHANIFDVQAYVENQIKIQQLTIRPGLRISYENYQNNLNYAPRLAAAYDVFGNGSTILTSGYNRYYDGNLLAHELRSKQADVIKACRGDIKSKTSKTTGVVTYSCDTTTIDPNNDWTVIPNSSFSASRVSDLKTPYSNEYTFGLQQAIFGGQAELLYIDREYKDQIVTVVLDKDENGYTYTEWRNSGQRDHKEFSASWERSWVNHFLAFNVTWEETKSNSISYIDTFDENQLSDEPDELDTQVWYEGHLTSRTQVPINDYNRPYRANLIFSANLPWNFSFTNETNFISRYKVVDKITSGDVVMPDGSTVDVKTLENEYYEKVTRHSGLIFDWKISWLSPEWRGNSIEFNLDILNVLNRKVEIGTEEDEYKLGRQFWAGLTYKF